VRTTTLYINGNVGYSNKATGMVGATTNYSCSVHVGYNWYWKTHVENSAELSSAYLVMRTVTLIMKIYSKAYK
jgi:hypothetical protein